MNCPHCSQPIDPALVRAAANKDAGSRARPRAKGQAKRGCMHGRLNIVDALSEAGRSICPDCHRPVRWNAKQGRWRIRYPKQKSPAE